MLPWRIPICLMDPNGSLVHRATEARVYLQCIRGAPTEGWGVPVPCMVRRVLKCALLCVAPTNWATVVEGGFLLRCIACRPARRILCTRISAACARVIRETSPHSFPTSLHISQDKMANAAFSPTSSQSHPAAPTTATSTSHLQGAGQAHVAHLLHRHHSGGGRRRPRQPACTAARTPPSPSPASPPSPCYRTSPSSRASLTTPPTIGTCASRLASPGTRPSSWPSSWTGSHRPTTRVCGSR